MLARTLRTAALALALSLVLTPSAMAFPEDPADIDKLFQDILEWVRDAVGGDDGYDYVDHEVMEFEGDGGGSGGGQGEPTVEER